MNSSERSNSIGQSGPVGVAPAWLEMQAVDALGPLTREALQEAPFSILALPIVQACEGRFDPRDPRVDRVLANNVKTMCRDVLLLDCSEQDADLGLKPIRRWR